MGCRRYTPTTTTTACIQQGGEVFTYDDNGNTLTKTIDGFVSTYSYDAKNHMAGGLLNDAGCDYLDAAIGMTWMGYGSGRLRGLTVLII